jgi:hypothetical protein
VVFDKGKTKHGEIIMKKLLLLILPPVFVFGLASAQNMIVFGPLEGDGAGILEVRNGENIEIEMWVRTDPANPAPVVAVAHGLMSDDDIIAVRNGVELDPQYDMPNWELTFVDGPFINNPNDEFPIPEGFTCEMQVGIFDIFPPPVGNPLDTQGDWDFYGAFLMTCNTEVPINTLFFPFQMGWFPLNGEGTNWAFEVPPGGAVMPGQDFGGLFFGCLYIPGDCNNNGVPLELSDVITMIGNFQGVFPPAYICDCGVDPPGPEFAATADPNGNCIPFELADVITEIVAFQGLVEALGCPDCPGLNRLLPGGGDQPLAMPSLKAKAVRKASQ